MQVDNFNLRQLQLAIHVIMSPTNVVGFVKVQLCFQHYAQRIIVAVVVVTKVYCFY